jgi:hypothetical protein
VLCCSHDFIEYGREKMVGDSWNQDLN